MCRVLSEVPLAAAAEGWVSGWLDGPLPATCSNISHAACTRCNALPTSAGISACLACAAGLKVPPLALLSTRNQDTRAEVCAACYANASSTAE